MLFSQQLLTRFASWDTKGTLNFTLHEYRFCFSINISRTAISSTFRLLSGFLATILVAFLVLPVRATLYTAPFTILLGRLSKHSKRLVQMTQHKVQRFLWVWKFTVVFNVREKIYELLRKCQFQKKNSTSQIQSAILAVNLSNPHASCTKKLQNT